MLGICDKNMESGRDVDEMILGQAQTLLPYLRAHGHTDLKVDSLLQIPSLFVRLFELVADITIDDVDKPFCTVQERARTLQRILDTFEQHTGVSMSHITGIGLATCERRHLSDMLQIFADLIHHFYPERPGPNKNLQGTPEGRELTLSLLEKSNVGWISFREFVTPPMSKTATETPQLHGQSIRLNLHKEELESRKSPVAAVPPILRSRVDPVIEKSVPDKSDGRLSPQPVALHSHIAQRKEQPNPTYRVKTDKVPHVSIPIFPDNQAVSVKASKVQIQKGGLQSSTTLLNHVCGASACAVSMYGDKRDGPVANKEKKNVQKTSPLRVFETGVQSMAMLSPRQKQRRRDSVRKERRPSDAKSHRFAPYNTVGEKPKVKNNACSAREVLDTRTKTIEKHTVIGRSIRKPSVKSFKSPATKSVRHSSVNSARYGSERIINRPCREFQEKIPTKKPDKNSVSIKEPAFLNNPDSKRLVSEANRPLIPSSARQTSLSNATVNPNRNLTDKSTGVKRTSVSTSSKHSAGKSVSEIPKDLLRGKQDRSNVAGEKEMRSVPEVHNSRRRPSVVSTKYRKHSVASPHSPVTTQIDKLVQTDRVSIRGEFSPQTVSLCSSLKLLKEFDHIRQRLRQIAAQRREHEEALRDLEHEEERLKHVLHHLHYYSELPGGAKTVPAGTDA